MTKDSHIDCNLLIIIQISIQIFRSNTLLYFTPLYSFMFDWNRIYNYYHFILKIIIITFSHTKDTMTHPHLPLTGTDSLVFVRRLFFYSPSLSPFRLTLYIVQDDHPYVGLGLTHHSLSLLSPYFLTRYFCRT